AAVAPRAGRGGWKGRAGSCNFAGAALRGGGKAIADALEPVFAALRERMVRAARGMDVAQDAAANLVLKTPWIEPGKKEPAWFGAVQLRKNYVSYHLMPVYALPALLEAVPPALRKRMQGKSCFNFKTVEPELFDALERLTARCAEAYATRVAPTPHSGDR
ncbi:MAG: hypothetical protein ACK40O_12185, partial [Allosphingosinicella sp.]